MLGPWHRVVDETHYFHPLAIYSLSMKGTDMHTSAHVDRYLHTGMGVWGENDEPGAWFRLRWGPVKTPGR